MHRRLYAGTLALVLAAAVGYAAAEDAIPGQGSSQERFNLNRQQEQSIMKGLHDEQAQSNPSGYQGQLGSKVPESMSAQELPGDVADQVPQTKGYYFVKLPDRVLLLDPDTKTVVEIVAGTETTGAGSNDNAPQSGGSSSPGGSR